jgi:hypothetical protein
MPGALPTCVIAAVAILALARQGDFTAAPRYDGAGYTVLARSLAQGTGYRAIDHPDQPQHAHFPPGYPAFLAIVWSVTSPFPFTAHVASSLCCVAATLAAWWWFRLIFRRDVAFLLGVALAINWAWARTGSAIQSEPLYELLIQATILAAVTTPSQGGAVRGAVLGSLMAASLLTRHIAIGVVMAVLLDLVLKRRWRTAAVTACVTVLLIAPWVGWLLFLGPEQRTQANMLLSVSPELASRILPQLVFYTQRIPDHIVGPFVEVATSTSLRRSVFVVTAANLWAIVATAVIVMGWISAVRRPRRRLGGLVPLLTLGMLLIWPYTEGGRFLIPLVPCLLIGAADGLSSCIRLAAWCFGIRVSRGRLAFAAAALILAMSLPYSCYSAIRGRSHAGDEGNLAFDAACAWIVQHGERPGPILTRHPGEVFLATGRQALEVSSSERPGERDAGPEDIAETIMRYHVAYLLVDEARYAQAPPSPLTQFVRQRPDEVKRVWSSEAGPSGVGIYRVLATSERQDSSSRVR